MTEIANVMIIRSDGVLHDQVQHDTRRYDTYATYHSIISGRREEDAPVRADRYAPVTEKASKTHAVGECEMYKEKRDVL